MKRMLINNVVTKRYVLILYTILFKTYKIITNGKKSYLFFYSDKQKKCIIETSEMTISYRRYKQRTNYFKNIEYTEMRQIGKGYSNWEDAKIIGIGNYNDIKNKID